jgi:hypothetical protein
LKNLIISKGGSLSGIFIVRYFTIIDIAVYFDFYISHRHAGISVPRVFKQITEIHIIIISVFCILSEFIIRITEIITLLKITTLASINQSINQSIKTQYLEKIK